MKTLYEVDSRRLGAPKGPNRPFSTAETALFRRRSGRRVRAVEAAPAGPVGKLGAVAHTELASEPLDPVLHGVRAQVDAPRDLLVGEAASDQLEEAHARIGALLTRREDVTQRAGVAVDEVDVEDGLAPGEAAQHGKHLLGPCLEVEHALHVRPQERSERPRGERASAAHERRHGQVRSEASEVAAEIERGGSVERDVHDGGVGGGDRVSLPGRLVGGDAEARDEDGRLRHLVELREEPVDRRALGRDEQAETVRRSLVRGLGGYGRGNLVDVWLSGAAAASRTIVPLGGRGIPQASEVLEWRLGAPGAIIARRRGEGKTVPEMPWKQISEPDGGRDYLALVTYLPLQRRRRFPSFVRSIQAVRGQLKDAPGLVGYSLKAKPLKLDFWTLSVWEDEGALQAFVPQNPHAGAMRLFGGGMANFRIERWTLAGTAVPPTWRDALARL